MAKRDPRKAAQLAHLDRVRPLAAPWHSSPEGLAWHREHGRRDWYDESDFVPRNCNRCGKEYRTPVPGASRYCSQNCSRAEREKAGAYNVFVDCPVCGIKFAQNKYKHTPKACSRLCGQRLRRQAASGS
jgi:hypothetical protein